MAVITMPRQIAYPIRDKRKQLGLTQIDLAEKAGISRQLVVSLEAGRATGITLDKLMSVLDVLGLSLSIDETKEKDTQQKKTTEQQDKYNEAFSKAVKEYKLGSSLFPGLNIFPGKNTYPGGKNAK